MTDSWLFPARCVRARSGLRISDRSPVHQEPFSAKSPRRSVLASISDIWVSFRGYLSLGGGAIDCLVPSLAALGTILGRTVLKELFTHSKDPNDAIM